MKKLNINEQNAIADGFRYIKQSSLTPTVRNTTQRVRGSRKQKKKIISINPDQEDKVFKCQELRINKRYVYFKINDLKSRLNLNNQTTSMST